MCSNFQNPVWVESFRKEDKMVSNGHTTGKSPKLKGGAARNADVVPDVDSGEIFSTRKADAVIYPTLRQVQSLLEESRAPHIPGSLNRLRGWFLRMEKGCKKDERTPFWKHLSWFGVLKSLKAIWTDRRAPDWKYFSSEESKVYNEVEADQAENLGPKSEFLPWTMDGPAKAEAVMSDKPKLPGFDEDAWRRSLSWVASWLPKGSIHHTTIEEAIQSEGGSEKTVLDTDTNSGFPSWTRGWYVTEGSPKPRTPARLATMDYVLKHAGAIVEASKHWRPGEHPVDTSWGTASQRTVSKGLQPLRPNSKGSYKGKRLVIAVPKPFVVAGKTAMSVIQWALARFAKNPSGIPIILGWQPMPQLDKGMQLLLEGANKAGRSVLSGDISAFDATLPPWAMWDVAQAASQWMDEETARLFLYIMYIDIYCTGLITPSGIIQPQPSSVKSGSIFTSLIGCLANSAIQKYGEFHGLYTIENVVVMGDDFCVDGDGITPQSVEAAFKAFGMECNASKQFCHPKMAHFLQRLHVLGKPGGIGSVARIGGGTLVVEDASQLEYDEHLPFEYIIQALARLENANFNPNFKNLCDWIARGDAKYHLGKDMDPNSIVSRAGSYGDKVMKGDINRPWKSTGTGITFADWAVNRVLRGETPPPPGKERFAWTYGVNYDEVQFLSPQVEPEMSKYVKGL